MRVMALSAAALALPALLAVPAPADPGSEPPEALRSMDATDGLPPQVTFSPERPVQGHLFVVRVIPTQGETLAAVGGVVADEDLHFEPGPDGSFESLAAVPIEVTDSLEVALVFTYRSGRREPFTASVTVDPGAYRHERLTVAPRFGTPLDSADQARLERDQARARQVSRQAHATPRLWTAEVVMPREARVTSAFGNGREFNGRISSRHMGLDLDGDPGDVVVAAARGVVALVDEFLLAGNIVYVNHGGGLLSGYFHLSEQLVSEGDTVAAGTPIGRVGATGRVTGPHLHWVVRYGTTSVDPRSLPGLPGR